MRPSEKLIWNTRIDAWLLRKHLMKKDWETEEEYQLKLKEYHINQAQSDIEKLENQINELKSLQKREEEISRNP